MANRRMISRRIVESAKFLKMPATSQNLYFHLCLNADDDGIVESYMVMRMVGASEDDLRVIVSKGFATLLNEDMLTYLNDWLEHNTIRPDRKIDSIYQPLLLQVMPEVELKESKKGKRRTNDGQMTDKCQPFDSVSKDKLSKDKLSKDKLDYQQIADMYNNTCVSFPRLTKLSDARKRAIKARLNTYSVEDFQKLFTMAEESDFLKGKNNRNWSANFDWLIKDSNMAKVLDGNYTEKPQEEPKTEYDMHYLDETMERILKERGDIFGEDAPFK